jgi:hypothetical protein
MKKTSRYSYLIACVILAYPLLFLATASDHQEWDSYDIRLSASEKLEDIFHSGLRPYRFPSLENSELEVKHLRARIITPDGEVLPTFDAEWLQINVHPQGLVSVLEFGNSEQPLSESRVEMLKWIPLGKEPRRTESELDQFLELVRKNPRGYDYGQTGVTHKFAIQWHDPANIFYGVWFHNCHNPKTPLAIYFAVSFPLKPRDANSFYDIPIPPPLGFEDVDMKAPRHFGPDSPPPAPEVERVMRAGKMPDYSHVEKYPRPAQPAQSAQSPDPNGWNACFWLITVTLALIACFGLSWRRHRKKLPREKN